MDEKKLAEITKEYKNFYSSLLKQGKLTAKDTGIGYWGVSEPNVLFKLFKKINLNKHPNFIDLGSGDGVAVAVASLFTNASGIEHDEELLNVSLKIKNKIFKNKKINLIKGNYLNHNISGYSIVFLHPDQPLWRNRLEEKLIKELRGKLIMYGAHFHPKELKKEQMFDIDGVYATVYSNQKEER